MVANSRGHIPTSVSEQTCIIQTKRLIVIEISSLSLPTCKFMLTKQPPTFFMSSNTPPSHYQLLKFKSD